MVAILKRDDPLNDLEHLKVISYFIPQMLLTKSLNSFKNYLINL